MHYLLLLFVPIALYRPRLSGLWFLPLLLWLTPSSNSHGATWRIALALAVVAVVAVRTLLRVGPAGAQPRRRSTTTCGELKTTRAGRAWRSDCSSAWSERGSSTKTR